MQGSHITAETADLCYAGNGPERIVPGACGRLENDHD
jgi:hypothetical protein